MTQDQAALHRLLKAVASQDETTFEEVLGGNPDIAQWAVSKGTRQVKAQEYFLADILLQVYAGDTALHIAAAAYRSDFARQLIARGATIGAQNRRGATPLHSAMVGSPGSPHWNPEAQAQMIAVLIALGANPNAVDKNGVTPLHRAARNRCAAAVKALLEGGADPRRRNGNGSTPLMLAVQTTGHLGDGSEAAKGQQAEIIRLLEANLL